MALDDKNTVLKKCDNLYSIKQNNEELSKENHLICSENKTAKEDSILEDNLINKIMLQTSYTYEEAKEKLLLFDNNVENIIKDYLGIESKRTIKKTVQQEMFSQFRNKFKNIKKI